MSMSFSCLLGLFREFHESVALAVCTDLVEGSGVAARGIWKFGWVGEVWGRMQPCLAQKFHGEFSHKSGRLGALGV